MKEEIVKIKRENEEKVNLYKEHAQVIVARKSELGEEYLSELSDSDLLNDDKFERAKLLKENDLLIASKDNEEDIVLGEKSEAKENETDRLKKEIDDKACGRKKRNV